MALPGVDVTKLSSLDYYTLPNCPEDTTHYRYICDERIPSSFSCEFCWDVFERENVMPSDLVEDALRWSQLL
jgi:hypothetical protein